MRPLMLSSCLFLLIALPATGQGLPALDGQGSQTQSIELAKDAVTITLESSGALSAGKGGVEGDGAARLTVNDLSVGVGGAQTGGAAAGGAHSPGGAVAEDAGSAATAAVQVQPATPAVDAIATGGVGQNAVCEGTVPTATRLADALRHSQVMLKRGECLPADGDVAAAVEAHVGLKSLLRRHGVAPNQVVAITIADEVVIVSLVMDAQITEAQ